MMQGFSLKWGWYHTFVVCAAAENKSKEDVMQMSIGEPKHVMRFKIGSTEYGMVPELNDIESGAFADAENHATELDGAHIFLNALYRPIKRKASVFYSVKGYDARRAVSLLDAPLSVYTSTLVFFYNLGKDLGIYTPSSTK